ncbi:DNA-directed RNA polymerase subunit sigma-70 [Methylacidiphilum kamchatkense Kam1]|uniref:DNA-directed RNA polymerase subunit sigma-70 n=1 Tax=Methylacidiphilum kamchatkense Kam1 TaxID=1202785 RepID=A0ABR4ZUN6_9BACT|nr:sigma factor [Methylacidiphilum kamchatkense]KIE57957.1 DNA-directed RNA polymerase subunit sigma-70 [Methylacidiphilum kamchatkense Kam1]
MKNKAQWVKKEIDWRESIKKFQMALHEEKLSLLQIPSIKKILIEKIIHLHEPSKQKRINAKEVVFLISLLRSKHNYMDEKVLAVLDKLRLNIIWWNNLREEAEKDNGKEAIIWKRKRQTLAEATEPLIINGIELIHRVVKTNNLNIKEAVFSDGIIGFYRALERYNPSSQNPFPNYALYWIKNEIAAEALKSKTVQISSYLKKKNSSQKNLNLEDPENNINNPQIVSLDAPINNEGDQLHTIIAGPNGMQQSSDNEELKKEWIQIIENAPNDIKSVLVLKYFYPVWEIQNDRYFLGIEAFNCRQKLSLKRLLVGIEKGRESSKNQ